MALGAITGAAGLFQQIAGRPSDAVEANSLMNEARVAKKTIETANRNAENMMANMGTKASQKAASAMGQAADGINF